MIVYTFHVPIHSQPKRNENVSACAYNLVVERRGLINMAVASRLTAAVNPVAPLERTQPRGRRDQISIALIIVAPRAFVTRDTTRLNVLHGNATAARNPE